MIKGIQISDSNGIPFYTKFGSDLGKFEGTILSGLISAIGNMSYLLFNKDVASISFGQQGDLNNIIILSKELRQAKKKIYFVFFADDNENISELRMIATTLFIQTKELLMQRTSEVRYVSNRIDKVLGTQFAQIAL
ncbi:MAG: hypothetical protein K9W44_06185 [Candidatus Lokiarchaeota archaeon]|nr:hypothetical protein [Candidatus Harpocratesius repetitus]